MSVVLPAPDMPTKATSSPLRTSSEMSRSAGSVFRIAERLRLEAELGRETGQRDRAGGVHDGLGRVEDLERRARRREVDCCRGIDHARELAHGAVEQEHGGGEGEELPRGQARPR